MNKSFKIFVYPTPKSHPFANGPIPSFIGDLPNLEVLQIWENNFTLELLANLGRNGKLLRLNVNHFVGPILEELAGFFNMPFLEMIESHLVIPLGISISFDEDTTEKLRSWTKEILVHHQTSTDAASNDDGDNDKYDTSRENGDSSAKVEEEPKCHEVAHNSGHSSNKESNGAMVKRESEVVVVAQA
ncbi:unnamed protein product [Camellia sinensis]